MLVFREHLECPDPFRSRTPPGFQKLPISLSRDHTTNSYAILPARSERNVTAWKILKNSRESIDHWCTRGWGRIPPASGTARIWQPVFPSRPIDSNVEEAFLRSVNRCRDDRRDGRKLTYPSPGIAAQSYAKGNGSFDPNVTMATATCHIEF